MKTYHFSPDAPKSLSGFRLWLQHRHFGEWHTICCLQANAARETLRFLDHHPTCTTIRVLAEAVGER